MSDRSDLSWMRSLCTMPLSGPYELPEIRDPGGATIAPHVLVIGALSVVHRGRMILHSPVDPPVEMVHEAVRRFWCCQPRWQSAATLDSLRKWCDVPVIDKAACTVCDGLGYVAFPHRDDEEEGKLIAEEFVGDNQGTTSRPLGVECPGCGTTSGYGRIGPLVIDRRLLHRLLVHVSGTVVRLASVAAQDHNPQREAIRERTDLFLGSDGWRARLYPVDYAGEAPTMPGASS